MIIAPALNIILVFLLVLFTLSLEDQLLLH